MVKTLGLGLRWSNTLDTYVFANTRQQDDTDLRLKALVESRLSLPLTRWFILDLRTGICVSGTFGDATGRCQLQPRSRARHRGSVRASARATRRSARAAGHLEGFCSSLWNDVHTMAPSLRSRRIPSGLSSFRKRRCASCTS